MGMSNALLESTIDATVAAVAANVRAEIARSGMGDGEFAREFGMTPMSMSRRLSGQTPFTTSEVDRIAEYFDVPIADLFRRPKRSPRIGGGARARAFYGLNVVGPAGIEPTTSTV